MPYILVRSAVLSSEEMTIKGDISQNARWQLQMQGSRGNETSLSSCDVLNILETEGYKVVGTNTVTQFACNDLTCGTHYMIWTLHKQA